MALLFFFVFFFFLFFFAKGGGHKFTEFACSVLCLLLYVCFRIPTETTLHENKHVCDYLSMYETLLLRNVVPFATGQCNKVTIVTHQSWFGSFRVASLYIDIP